MPIICFISQSKLSFPCCCVVITRSLTISIRSKVVFEFRQFPHSFLMLYQIRIRFEVLYTDKTQYLHCFCHCKIDDCHIPTKVLLTAQQFAEFLEIRFKYTKSIFDCVFESKALVIVPIDQSDIIRIQIFENLANQSQSHFFISIPSQQLFFSCFVNKMCNDSITFGDDSVSILQVRKSDGCISFDQFWFILIKPFSPTLLAFIFLFAVWNGKIFQDVSNSFCKPTNGPITEFDFGFSLLHLRYIYIIKLRLLMEGSSTNRLIMIGQHITKPQPLVKYEAKGSFLTVTLNRPKALNSLNLDMVNSITQNYEFINQHQVVWFQGAGGKAFCAGGDVKALFEKDATVNLRLNFFKNQFLLDYRIANLKALQISCWDGITMGGGVGISGFAPFIIATQKTVFAMPEVKIGFYTDVGFSYLLARMKNNIGYYLGLTGASLKGQQVYNAGIANYFVPSAKIPQVYQQITKLSSQQHENIKQLVADTLLKYHVAPKTHQLPHQQDIKYLFGLGSAKAIYQEALTQKNEFYRSIVKIFKTVCPVSVELVHRLITNAKNIGLKETFILDYVILQHMAVNPDFREGVRSVLIEKGSTPKWSCEDLLQVKQQHVDYFFKPIQGSTTLKI